MLDESGKAVRVTRTDIVDEIQAAETARLGKPVYRREVVDSALLHCREHGLVRLHPETAPRRFSNGKTSR